MVSAKMEIVLKFNQLPSVKTVGNQMQFALEVDTGQTVTITVKPKVWRKLESAAAEYTNWVAVVTGQVGDATESGFTLETPSLQVFEKKTNPAVEPASSSDGGKKPGSPESISTDVQNKKLVNKPEPTVRPSSKRVYR